MSDELQLTPAYAPLVLEDASGLKSFFQALHELESGRSRQPLTILQIGDSHTAGGWFTARLRSLFQERFGSAGRGMMPPGRPYRYYRPHRVKIEQSDDWEISNSFIRSSEGVFGLTGFRLRGSDKKSIMSLEYEEEEGFNWVEVEYLAQPDGGTMHVQVDGQPLLSVATGDESIESRFLAFNTLTAGRFLEILLEGDGPVDLLSWTVQRDRPGIVFDSHGIVGATVNVIKRWDEQTVVRELAHRQPDLMIVEYGGNEGFDNNLRPVRYKNEFRHRVNLLKQAAPRASIMIIGPADGLRLPGYCLRQLKKKRAARREEKKGGQGRSIRTG